MHEGWFAGEYLVLFGHEEARAATKRYDIAKRHRAFTVVGLPGWDDPILRDPQGSTCSVPAVPLDLQLAQPFAVPDPSALEPDARFSGKVKWYIKPLVFGGDANAKDNLTWVTHEQHRELVAWWNGKYLELKAGGVGA
jgi:hypothetical protein